MKFVSVAELQLFETSRRSRGDEAGSSTHRLVLGCSCRRGLLEGRILRTLLPSALWELRLRPGELDLYVSLWTAPCGQDQVTEQVQSGDGADLNAG